MTASERVYRALLRFYPAAFRNEYGAEMAALFCRRLDHERPLGLWLEVITDLVTTAPKEHTHMLWNDVRYSFRVFAKTPGFVVSAVLSLALGIGVNTAIFQFVNTVLLERIHVRAPQELMGMARVAPKYYKTNFSYHLYQELRERTDVFNGVIAHADSSFSMSSRSGAEIVKGELVSGNYFDVLGVQAALGRTFTSDDDGAPGAHPVAVLSYGFWERRFGSDPGVLGATILLAGHPFTIVGVSQKGFFGTELGSAPDVRVPMIMQNQVIPGRDLLHTRDVSWFEVIARLRPGVDYRLAQQVANAVYLHSLETQAQIAHLDATQFAKDQGLVLFPADRGGSGMRDALGKPLLVVLALSALVLLLTCANVANLLFARASARKREVALRIALGAGRVRLIRHFLTKSMLIAAIGGALGVLLAVWCGSLLPKLLPRNQDVSLELHTTTLTLVFAGAITILSGLFFGLLPAWRSSKSEIVPALQEGFGGYTSGKSRMAVRNTLVAAQVAFSTMLLLGAALFGRTLGKLRSVDLGFDRNSVYLFTIDPQLNGYTARQSADLYQRLLDRVRTMPSIESASLARVAILGGGGGRSTVSVEGYQFQPGEDRNLNDNMITPGYLRTLKSALLRGRDFADGDRAGAAKVALINETTARYFFGSANPIGKRIGFGRDSKPDIEIIGVIKDGKYRNVREATWRTIYVPLAQASERSLGQMTLHVRAGGDISSVAGGVRAVLAELDPNLPILSAETLAERVERNLGVERLVTLLSSSFGLLSLLLAALGLYGVIACSVSERRREIGIRIALGARPADVVWVIMRQSGVSFVTGISIGLVSALALGRFIQSLLYGVAPSDTAAIGGTIVVLAITASVACYAPARRSVRVDPIAALRYE
jgi:predicted permease